MNWFAVFSVGLLATFKFMFAAFPGPAFNISFFETYICIVLGGTLSSAVFYFASDYLCLKQIKSVSVRSNN